MFLMETEGAKTAEEESVNFTLTLSKRLYDLIDGELPKTGALRIQDRIRQILAEHYNGKARA